MSNGLNTNYNFCLKTEGFTQSWRRSELVMSNKMGAFSPRQIYEINPFRFSFKIFKFIDSVHWNYAGFCVFLHRVGVFKCLCSFLGVCEFVNYVCSLVKTYQLQADFLVYLAFISVWSASYVYVRFLIGYFLLICIYFSSWFKHFSC